MADNAGSTAALARLLAFAHIMVGFLLFCFGVTDRIMDYFWPGSVGFGIWIGTWMCITGALGILGATSRSEGNTFRDAFVGLFMGFSITSAVFGGTLVLFYSVSIAENRREPPTSYSTTSPENRRLSDYNEAEIVISAMILILGITEFVIGIWAAVCCYLMRPCRCCVSTLSQQGQPVVYTSNPQLNSAGYVMVHWPASDPLAPGRVSLTAYVPVQTGGGRIANQGCTLGAHQEQLPVILLPSSEAVSAHIAVPGQTGVGIFPIETFTSEPEGDQLQIALVTASGT